MIYSCGKHEMSCQEELRCNELNVCMAHNTLSAFMNGKKWCMEKHMYSILSKIVERFGF